MEIGLYTPPLANESFEGALAYCNEQGVTAIEPGVGAFPGQDHLPRADYLEDAEAQTDLEDVLETYEIRISTLAVHNNPLHRTNSGRTGLRPAVTVDFVRRDLFFDRINGIAGRT